MADKRIIELANEKLVLADGDMTIVDSESGTYKYDLNRLAKKTITDTTLSVEGKPADAKAVGDALSLVNVDTVNNARQLLSENYVLDQEPYLFRASGGDGADRAEECIVGGSVAWNQIADNESTAGNHYVETWATTLSINNGEITATNTRDFEQLGINFVEKDVIIPNNHVFLCAFDVKSVDFTVSRVTITITDQWSGIISSPTKAYTGPGRYSFVVKTYSSGTVGNLQRLQIRFIGTVVTGEKAVLKNCVWFDLTQMFGSTIADYIYSLEQATAGAGVAWFKKLFPKDYYPYDAGTLKSVEGVSAHEMTGFNAYNPTTGKAKVVGNNVYQITGTYTALSLDGTTITPDASGYFTPDHDGELTVTGGNSTDTCVHLKWDGERDGEYEPYESHSYPLDSTLTLRGIPRLDANNSLYYDGDTYESDGTVTRKYGIVDLGTLTWDYNTTKNCFTSVIAGCVLSNYNRYGLNNVICAKYIEQSWASIDYNTAADKTFHVLHISGPDSSIWIFDSTYSDAATFKTAMSGQYLVYELATPTTESATPYTALQTLDPNGTEEFVSTGIVPVGHESHYLENLRSKIEGLPRDFSTLIAPTEATYKATRNYTSGSLLIVGNILYKATSNIANGATITPNTNCTATTLAAVIAALA